MSLKAVIASVIIVLAVAGIVIFTNLSPNKGNAGTTPNGSGSPQLVNSPGGPDKPANNSGTPRPVGAAPLLDPAKVTALRIIESTGEEALVTLTADGGWAYTDFTGVPWPVNPARVQAVLRSLADLKPADGAAPSIDRPLTVMLSLSGGGGGAASFRFATDPVGGKVAAEASGTPALNLGMVDANLLDGLTTSGPRLWRATGALPGDSAALSRISLTTDDANIQLVKDENTGRWSLRAPVAGRANASAVASLVQALESLSVERFLDSPDEMPSITASGLNDPRMVIRLESDVRTADASGNVSVRTRSRMLFVGGPADLSGQNLYASPDASSSMVFVVPASSVAMISTSPSSFMSVSSLDANPENVGMMIVRTPAGEQGYRRTGAAGSATQAWAKINADGTTTPVEAGAVEELLNFLSNQPGEPAPAPQGVDQGLRLLARVELLNAQGERLDIISMGYNAEKQLVARTGSAVVTYPRTSPPAVLQMPSADQVSPSTPVLPEMRVPADGLTK